VKTLPDIEIINRVEAGQLHGVMDVLYESQYPKLKSYILKNNGSEHDAEDIFQEAMIILFSHITRKKFDKEKDLGGFLYVVACNLYKRSKRRKPFEELQEDQTNTIPDFSYYTQVFQQDTRKQIDTLLALAGENCKKLLHLTMNEHYSMKEIQAEMGYESIDTVKTRHYKCKKKLITGLKERPNYAQFIKKVLQGHG